MVATASLSRSSYAGIKALVGESSTTLTASELQRMRDIAMDETEREARKKAAIESANAVKIKAAKERKEKMLELEAQRKLAVPPSDVEQQKLVPSQLHCCEPWQSLPIP